MPNELSPEQMKELDELVEGTEVEELSAALEIIRLQRMFDYQRKDWGFEAASERQWKAWVMRQE